MTQKPPQRRRARRVPAFATALLSAAVTWLSTTMAFAQTQGPINQFDPSGAWSGSIKCREVGDGAWGAYGPYEKSFSVDIDILIAPGGDGPQYPYRIIWMYPNGIPPVRVLDFAESLFGHYFASVSGKNAYFGAMGGGTAAVLVVAVKNNGLRTMTGESTRASWSGDGPFIQLCDWDFKSTTPPAY